ncbi:MAG: hypothetical protein ABIN55_07470 [Aeromicrobium sp.]
MAQLGVRRLIVPLRPLAEFSAADWFGGAHVLGPAGFDAYARVLHPWTAGVEGRERIEGHLPQDELRALCDVLARHTATADHCFFALWDGYGEIYGGESVAFLTAFTGPAPWPERPFRKPKPKEPPPPAFAASVIDGPRLTVGAHDYLLFTGPVSDAGVWGAASYGGGVPRDLNSPNLIWPDDHAWFVTTDIEGTWTGVGGSEALITELVGDQRLEVVRTRYEGAR